MKAAVLAAPGKITISEAPIPQPGPSQIRVKVEGCGVCASNLPPWAGKPWFNYPLTPGALGHEAWGRIDEVGSDAAGWKRGQRVAFLSSNAYAEYEVADLGAVVALPPEFDSL